MTSRPSTFARYFIPVLALFALIVVPLGAYVGGYFWLGEYTWYQSPGREVTVERHYRHQWLTILFTPAAKVEELVRGNPVWLRYKGDGRGGII